MGDPPATHVALPDLPATEALGAHLAASLRPGDVVLLNGPYGAGKTALARAIIRALVADPAHEVTSPSYQIVQIYEGAGCPIAHYDLCRLGAVRDLDELGWEEALEGIVLVEWPELIRPFLDRGVREVTMALGPAGQRQATLTGWPDA